VTSPASAGPHLPAPPGTAREFQEVALEVTPANGGRPRGGPSQQGPLLEVTPSQGRGFQGGRPPGPALRTNAQAAEADQQHSPPRWLPGLHRAVSLHPSG